MVVAISGRVGASPVVQPVLDDGLEVHLRPFIELPDSSTGMPPRINAFASVDGDLFVGVQTDGLIYRVGGSLDDPQVSVWFDVAAAIDLSTDQVLDNTNGGHGGLRSIAFHPDYLSNGLFYTSVMEQRPATSNGHRYISDVAAPIAADSVLIEWRTDLTTMLPVSSSYREVFRVGMPVYDHPIKGISFDPFAAVGDENYGLLYVAHGDASVLSAIAGGGQNNDALGKILRIDPMKTGDSPYAIPTTNPFVNDASIPNEVYSIGHRNPHNVAFAMVDGTSLLLVAEAGRDNVEEINIIRSGGDYGWPQREGTFVHLASGGEDVGVAPLPSNEAQNGFTYPAAQLGHTGASNKAIAGGYAIDNGSALDGHYFYADFPISGKLFHNSVTDLAAAVTELDPGNPSLDDPADLSQAAIHRATIRFDHDRDSSTAPLAKASLLDVFDDSPLYDSPRADVRFGQGPQGELYVSSKHNNTIYLVTSSLPEPPVTQEPPKPTTAWNVTGTPGRLRCPERTSNASLLRCGRSSADAWQAIVEGSS